MLSKKSGTQMSEPFRRSGRRRTLVVTAAFAVGFCATFFTASRPQAEPAGFGLPGLGRTSEGAKPRVLVILDTSGSMAATPNYSARYEDDDYDPLLDDGVSDVCKSRFCMAKRAMYHTLEAHGKKMEVGVAGYYQTERTIEYKAVAPGYTHVCTYDAIAKAGANVEVATVKLYEPDTANSTLNTIAPCSAKLLDSMQYKNAPSGQTVEETCNNIGTRNCKLKTLSTTDSTVNLYRHPNAACQGSPPSKIFTSVPLDIHTAACDPTDAYEVPGYVWALTATAWSGTDKLVSNAQSDGSCPAMYSEGSYDYFLLSTTPPGRGMEDRVISPGNPTRTIYRNAGGSTYTYPGSSTTYNYPPSGPTATYTNIRINMSAVGEPCEDRPNYKDPLSGGGFSTTACSGTASDGGCDLKANIPKSIADTTTYADQTAYTPNMSFSGYSVKESAGVVVETYSYTVNIPNSCAEAEGKNFDIAGSKYQGVTGLPCATSDGASGVGRCYATQLAYKDNSDSGKRTCSFQIKRWTYAKPPTVGTPYCQYTGSSYKWSTQIVQCRYRYKQYTYRRKAWTYVMLSNEDDIIGNVTKSFVGTSDQCESKSVSTTSCPDSFTSGCTSGAKGCYLHRAERYGNSANGRTSGATYCPATAASRPRWDSADDWCSATLTTQPLPRQEVKTVVADYYWPAASNKLSGYAFSDFPAQFASLYPGQPLGAVTFQPPLHAKKDLAISLVHHGADMGKPALSFVPVGPDTATYTGTGSGRVEGDALKAVRKYDEKLNPKGLRRAQEGDYTPLHGSLVSAKDYLSALMATDDARACRDYFVLLVTDGAENQQAANGDFTHSGEELVGAVKGLKEIGIPSFVVGFGVADANLDSMAVAGGFPDEGGKAFNAGDYDGLMRSLNDIFSTITAGKYTRSRPLLARSGDSVYLGYFEVSPGTASSEVVDDIAAELKQAEWKGHLDAYAVSRTGRVSSDVRWNLADQRRLNSNAHGDAFRKIYAGIDRTGVRTNELFEFDVLANPKAGNFQLYMGLATPADTEATIQFIRNDRGARQSFDIPGRSLTKTSRLSDIFHSDPVFLHDAPGFSKAWTVSAKEFEAYRAFMLKHQNRPPMVFVGSNTGMVHAVHEKMTESVDEAAPLAGQESWAFVPSAVLKKMPWLRTKGHQFMADGGFAMSDVCFSDCLGKDGAGWRTVLVGTLGWGGNAVFALDVSDPTTPELLWEKNGLPQFGDTFSPPNLGRVRLSDGSFHWVAVLGGGWTETFAPEYRGLNVLNLETGDIFTDGNSYATFPLPSYLGGTGNVLGRATILRPDETSVLTAAYVTDADGKLWKSDFTKGTVASWGPRMLFNPLAPTPTSGCPDVYLSRLPDDSGAGLSLSQLYAESEGIYPVAHNRPYRSVDDGQDGTKRNIFYYGTGDSTAPEVQNSRDYFFAVRDDLGAEGTCDAPLLWGKRLAEGWKVLGEPTIEDKYIIFAVYKPASTLVKCGGVGSSTLYCFDKRTGEPQACLYDPQKSQCTPEEIDTGACVPDRVAYIDVGRGGIVSNFVSLTKGLFGYTTSDDPKGEMGGAEDGDPDGNGSGGDNNPDRPDNPIDTVGVLYSEPVRVQSWRRLQ